MLRETLRVVAHLERPDAQPDLSIGVTMGNLWSDAHVAQLQGAGHYSPWDNAPIIGFDEPVGIVHLRPTADGEALEQFRIPVPGRVVRRPSHVLSLHRSRLPQLAEAVPVQLLAA